MSDIPLIEFICAAILMVIAWAKVVAVLAIFRIWYIVEEFYLSCLQKPAEKGKPGDR